MPYRTQVSALAYAIHARNVRYGFKQDDVPRDPTTVTMLIISELAEAFEELRKGYDPNYIYYSCGKPKDADYHEIHPDEGELVGVSPWFRADGKYDDEVLECDIHIRAVKPEGFGIEYADALIRLLDAGPEFDLNYDLLVPHKMAFNDTRPPKHGKTM